MGRALIGIFQADADTRDLVFATRPETARLPSTSAALAEQGLKEIAEITTAEATRPAETMLLPTWRRPELLPLFPVGAELVIGLALFWILEHFVGFIDFLETRFGIRLFTDIRMVFTR